MKKLLTAAALGMFCLSGMAQEAKEGFEFTVVKTKPSSFLASCAIPLAHTKPTAANVKSFFILVDFIC